MSEEDIKICKYSRVLISSIFKRKTRIGITTNEEYLKQVKLRDKKGVGGICEIVGLEELQVKPYFDIDIIQPKDIIFNENIIEDIEKDIKLISNNDIYISKRPPREKDTKIKYSYRLYLKARITYSNIPILFKPVFDKYKIIDKSVYNINRILFTPLNTIKKDDEVPKLETLKGDIFDNCATYIKEDYNDLDLLITKVVQTKPEKTNDNNDNNDDGNDIEETPNKYNRLEYLIGLLKEERSECFDTWIKINWCIINICNKENITKRKCENLIHLFSKKAINNYNEDKVAEWIDVNYPIIKNKGYGWTYLLHTCIKQDAPNYYENLTQSYYIKKKDFEKNNFKIIYPPMIIHEDRNNKIIIQPIPMCEKSNMHLRCTVKEIGKKGEIKYKDKQFIKQWLEDPTIKKYDYYVFKPPPLKIEDYEFNTWRGFEIERTPYEEDETVIERFLDYMNNLFDNKDVVNYLLAYFSNRLQNPSIRNNVCVILYGEEGDGKNRFLDIFKNIIGDKYYTELESSKQLFGSHCCVEKEQIFICVNEAKGKDNYENSDILKSRITTNTLKINPKGIQEFMIENYCDYIMTTNNNNAVNLHDKSRRYLYIETTSYYSQNDTFFNSFSNEIVENKEALRVIFEYLKKFNIKDVIPSGNFQKHIPETEIQKTIIDNNRDKILIFLDDFIFDYLNDELNEDKTTLKINNNDLFYYWCKWIDRNRIEIKYNYISFNSRLGHLMKKKINTTEEIIIKDNNKNTIIDILLYKKKFNN